MASLLTKPTYNVKICSNGIITQPLYEEQIKKGNSKKDSGIDLFCPKTVQIQSGEIKLIDMEVKCAVYKNGEPLIVELSYTFSMESYNNCTGFWDENLNWNKGQFNPQAWMIKDLLDS